MSSYPSMEMLNQKIKALRVEAEKLKRMAGDFPAVARNTERILASTKMLEINVSDALEEGGIESRFGQRDIPALFAVALGKAPADLAVVNARMVNVYTGEIQDGTTVCVKDQWIAYVGRDAGEAIGSGTTVIDAQGQTLIPGLVEGHTHLATLFDLGGFLNVAMAGGTTTIVTETLEIYSVMGIEGVLAFLEACAGQPVKILGLAPGMGSISPALMGLPARDAEVLMQRPDILGLGETYWQTVLQNPGAMLPAYNETLRAGKCLEGHSAGASEKKLNAYAAAGVTSCHEPIRPEEVRERLRLGIHVMIREGGIRRDLEEISKLKDENIDFRRLILATDGVTPHDLLETGYLEHVVQKAVDYGFNPVTAIQMATLNVAEHFGLDDVIGGIAPGRQADFVLIPDERTINAHCVVSKGRVIAENGRLLVGPRAHAYPEAFRQSIRLSADLSPADFEISAGGRAGLVDIRIIELITDLVTRETVAAWPVKDDRIDPDPAGDVIKVAAIDRTHTPGKMAVGLLKGFGLTSGAIASSAAWDTSDIIVAGANDADMALCVNRIREIQGGAVACNHGKIIAELPLPILGVMSAVSVAELAGQIAAMNKAMAELGVPHPDPLLTLATLTGAAIPYLRICEAGLVNLKNGREVDLFVE
jgi:adenine deaminase